MELVQISIYYWSCKGSYDMEEAYLAGHLNRRSNEFYQRLQVSAHKKTKA